MKTQKQDNFNIIRKYCLLTVSLNCIAIIAFIFFMPIVAYYLSFFSGFFFILALRSAYIKINLLNLRSFGKFLFLILLVIPFYVAFYIYLSKVLGFFSVIASIALGTIIFYIFLGLYVIKKYNHNLVNAVLIYSILIPSFLPYFSYLINNGSGLYPMFGLISAFIWQISTSIILSEKSIYSLH